MHLAWNKFGDYLKHPYFLVIIILQSSDIYKHADKLMFADRVKYNPGDKVSQIFAKYCRLNVWRVTLVVVKYKMYMQKINKQMQNKNTKSNKIHKKDRIPVSWKMKKKKEKQT